MNTPTIIAAPRNDLFEDVAQLGRVPWMRAIETARNAVVAQMNHDLRMDDLEAALDEASDDDILSLESLLLDQLRRRRLDARSRANDLAQGPNDPPLAPPHSRRQRGVTVRLPGNAFDFMRQIDLRDQWWTRRPPSPHELGRINMRAWRDPSTAILAGGRDFNAPLLRDLQRGGVSEGSGNRARRRIAARRREEEEQPHHMVMDNNDELVALVLFGEEEQYDVRDKWYFMHQVAIDMVVIGLFRLAIIGPHWIYG